MGKCDTEKPLASRQSGCNSLFRITWNSLWPRNVRSSITHCYFSPDSELGFAAFLPISLSARAVLDALVLLQNVQAWTLALAWDASYFASATHLRARAETGGPKSTQIWVIPFTLGSGYACKWNGNGPMTVESRYTSTKTTIDTKESTGFHMSW